VTLARVDPRAIEVPGYEPRRVMHGERRAEYPVTLATLSQHQPCCSHLLRVTLVRRRHDEQQCKHRGQQDCSAHRRYRHGIHPRLPPVSMLQRRQLVHYESMNPAGKCDTL